MDHWLTQGERSCSSTRLAFYLLGPPKLEVNDVPVVIDRRKIFALLAYLAVHPWEHHRDHISALFWPDYPQPKAFSNLRHILWEVRRAIGKDWIRAGRDTIELTASLVAKQVIWVDAASFHALKTGGVTEPDPSHRVPLLTEAVNLYRNHFLTGFTLKDAPGFNEWVRSESDRLRDQLAEALVLLANDLCSLGRAGTAIGQAQRLVTLDPWNEASHRLLMEIYMEAGQPGAALRQYETCKKILRTELGVEPQPETNLLYKRIRR